MVDAVHTDSRRTGATDVAPADGPVSRDPASRRRDDVLDAVAFAAERFLRAARWRDVADEVMCRLGIAAGASRAYIVANGTDEATARTWVAEWCDAGVAPSIDAPGVAATSWEASGFGRWAEKLALGETIAGPSRSMAPSERAALEDHGVAAVAVMPVVVDGGWWGAIAFDDCRGERDWSGSELDALRTASSLLSAAIERERREERLQVAERRYRSFVEGIPAVTYTDVIGPNGATLGYVSPQIEDVLGYPAQAFVDDPSFWFRVMHPDDLAELEAKDAFANDDERPFDEEYRMIAADGRTVWVHDTSLAVHDEAGRLAYFQGFLVDVTSRRTAQEALHTAQERFRVLVEQMPVVVYSQRLEPGTTEGVAFEYVSPFVETMLGLRPDEVIGSRHPWTHLVHPDDRDRAVAAVTESDAFGEPMAIDYRIVRGDGSVRWVHEESVLVRDARGEPTHWQGFLLDLTERVEGAEQVRIAQERFRVIVEQTPAITYRESVTDGPYDGTAPIEYVSPQIETILGYTPAEWTAPGFWTSVTHPDDLPSILELGARTTATGTPYRQEYRVRAKDGRWVWLHDECRLIRDAEGHPAFWQGVLVDVTDRKLAELELGRAQARLQALIEHIPAVVYTQSPGGGAEDFWISPQVRALLGYTQEEWASSQDFWVDRIHPDDRERVLGADTRTDESLEPFSEEYRFRKADGTYAWILDESVFVHDVGGTGRGFWQGLLFDVTARREADEQLRDAERVLRATVENLPAIVYRESADAEPGTLYLSRQVRALTGWSADTWATTPGFWWDHIHPEDRGFVREANDRANATREPYSVEYRFRHADGRWVWLHDEATFIHEPGSDGFWQGFMFDVTERKQAEQQLREAEEKFRTIVEQNQAIFYIQEIDPDDPTISLTSYIAPGNADLIGYTVEEIRDDPGLWRRIIHPDDRRAVLDADAASNTGEDESFSMEYRMIRKDGRIVWVQDEARLIRPSEGQPYWQGFLLDITERKQAEEQLAHALEVEREAATRLRALDEMKNTFLQAVSHDLRTPLAAILGLAVTLERPDVDIGDDESRELARRIADNARRLDRLVTNLLDLDRLSRGIVAPKREPTDVGELVRSIVERSELIGPSRLRLDLEPVVAEIDAAKVERIVENLLANTARHTPSHATVWVSVHRVDDGVRIAVEDDGPGIAPAIREAIFEPFEQGPEAPRHAPGVGVGLTLVRRFAELHGGRAWVEERDGGGASFRVVLPCQTSEAGRT